jgi:hypothetical protein
MYPNLKTTILIGPPGSGKSHFIHRYIRTILDDPKDQSQLVLIDPKRTELSTFKQSKKTLAYINAQIEQSFDASTLKELQTRYHNLKEGKSNKHLSTIYFIFDEFRDVFTLNPTKSIRALTKLMNQKEPLNIEFVMSSQSEDVFKPFIKSANTVIQFTNNAKSMTKESLNPTLKDYLDFNCVGLYGKLNDIEQFSNGYLKVIPKASLVYHFSSQEPNKIKLFVEDLVHKAEQNQLIPIKHSIAFAFIEINGKFMSNLSMLNDVHKLIILAKRFNLMVVISTDQPRLPLSITQHLHSTIKFNLI